MIHDSPLIKNIADETVEKILDLYQQFTKKQVFIAFDKEQAYTPRTQTHVEQTTVIQLGEDKHALYGFAWNPENARTPEEQCQDEEDLQDIADTLRSDQRPL
ncbi:hypothetical protein JOD55_000936 [Arcanobacterium pluranimalium]|nr:hypothetical protein [Arcanobacterium pluranimalium]